MKKAYATPTVMASDDVVRATKGPNSGPEVGPTGIPVAPGSVGFYL